MTKLLIALMTVAVLVFVVVFVSWYADRARELKERGCTAHIIGKATVWKCPESGTERR